MSIKEIRQLTGLSQRKFSEFYNIPRRTVEDWEAGKSEPPEYTRALLERVAREDFQK